MRILPRKQGRTRDRISAAVEKKIREQIEYAAERYDCSKSFIQNVALADFFKIKLDFSLYDPKKVKKH